MFWDMRKWDMRKVCLQTLRNNRIRLKLGYFLRNVQTSRANNSRVLRIKKWNFQGIGFISTQTYWTIFKSALVYLLNTIFKKDIVFQLLLRKCDFSLKKKKSKACYFILAQAFSCEFCEISKNTFFYRTSPVAASVVRRNTKHKKDENTRIEKKEIWKKSKRNRVSSFNIYTVELGRW